MYEESPRVKLLYKQFQGPLLGLGTDLSNLIKEGRILDAGCGIGDLVSELQRLNPETYGIDIESDMIDGIEGLAGAKQRVLYPDKVVGGDIAEPPFPNEYFDTIMSNTLFASTEKRAFKFLEMGREIPSIEKVQEEMVNGIYRVCKKGGLYLIFDNKSIANLPIGDFSQLYPSNNERFGNIRILRK